MPCNLGLLHIVCITAATVLGQAVHLRELQLVDALAEGHRLPSTIREDLEIFEQLQRESRRQNVTVGELGRRIKARALAVSRAMDTYQEAQKVAAEVNMSLQELGANFAQRSLAIREVRQAFGEVNQTARMLNVPLQDQQKKIHDKAKTIDEVVRQWDEGGVAASSNPQPLLFIGIYTAFSELAKKRRREIRDTYLQQSLVRAGGPIVWKFVAGFAPAATAGSKEESDLEKEAFHFPSQFLRLRIEETYEGLTAKTFALMKWFADASPAKWLLKLDDDTFPHLGRIHEGLLHEHGKFVQLGMVFDCAPVLRHTKWAENVSLWNHSFFPKYMQGSGYFLSESLVKHLAQDLHEQNKKLMLRNEDAAIGVWIETEKRAHPDWPVTLKSVASTLSGCSPNDWISMNNQLGYMTCYWNRFTRGEKDVCCYGPLNNLRQSLLQQSVNTRMSSGCHQSAVDAYPA